MSPFFTPKPVDHMLINFKVGGWRLVKKVMYQVLSFLLSFQKKKKKMIVDKDLINESNVYLYFYRMPEVYE